MKTVDACHAGAVCLFPFNRDGTGIKVKNPARSSPAKICTVVVIGLLFVSFAGCASAPKQTGFLDGYYKGLGPGPKGGVDERWLRPGVNFAKYNKLMIDSVIFYYAPDSEDKGIDGEKMRADGRIQHGLLVNVLKEKHPIVAEPGNHVARLSVALTGVKKSKPVVGAVSSVLPAGIGISIIKRVAPVPGAVRAQRARNSWPSTR